MIINLIAKGLLLSRVGSLNTPPALTSFKLMNEQKIMKELAQCDLKQIDGGSAVIYIESFVLASVLFVEGAQLIEKEKPNWIKALRIYNETGRALGKYIYEFMHP